MYKETQRQRFKLIFWFYLQENNIIIKYYKYCCHQRDQVLDRKGQQVH